MDHSDGGSSIAPVVTAFGGAAVAYSSGGQFWDNWLRWYMGHALGALTFTPMVLLITRGDAWRWLVSASPGRVLEALALLMALVLTAWLVFAQTSMPLLFLPMLPLTITAFRLGRFGAALSVVLLAIIGGYFTVAGQGPISLLAGSQEVRLQFLQFYLAVTVLTALPIAADLANRKQLLAQLRDSEARYRLLTTKSTDIVLNLDVEGIIRFASPSIKSLGGYEPDEAVGHNALELVHPPDIAAVTATHRQALAEPERTHIVEHRGLGADGREIWLETHTQGVVDKDGSSVGVVSTIREISHRKHREEVLRHEAETDILTGIANRRGFLRRLERCLSDPKCSSPGCVAMFDIDFFKRVNDHHGHAVGDRVLQEFARMAGATLRDHDFIGRLGGEEFGVLLSGATAQQALIICDRVRQHVEAIEVFCSNGELVKVTVSAGVARIGGAQDGQSVLEAADAALYHAKAAGRNCLKLAA